MQVSVPVLAPAVSQASASASAPVPDRALVPAVLASVVLAPVVLLAAAVRTHHPVLVPAASAGVAPRSAVSVLEVLAAPVSVDAEALVWAAVLADVEAKVSAAASAASVAPARVDVEVLAPAVVPAALAAQALAASVVPVLEVSAVQV